MGRPRGLEPPTPGTTNQCSNQLSYDRHGRHGSGSLGRAGHLGSRRANARRGTAMNPTIEKFGYPATLLHEFDHWLVLLRPAQVTLGSLVLAAKSDATAYRRLPTEAFAEQARRSCSDRARAVRLLQLRAHQLSDADDGRPERPFPRHPALSGSRAVGRHRFSRRGLAWAAAARHCGRAWRQIKSRELVGEIGLKLSLTTLL